MKKTIFSVFIFFILAMSMAFAMDSVTDGKTTIVTGTIYDSQNQRMGEGITVDVYCVTDENPDGVKYDTITTNAKGDFFSTEDSYNCPAESKVFVKALDKKSLEVEVRSISRKYNSATADIFGVPEFTTITLGITLVGALAGLMYVRRK